MAWMSSSNNSAAANRSLNLKRNFLPASGPAPCSNGLPARKKSPTSSCIFAARSPRPPMEPPCAWTAASCVPAFEINNQSGPGGHLFSREAEQQDIVLAQGQRFLETTAGVDLHFALKLGLAGGYVAQLLFLHTGQLRRRAHCQVCRVGVVFLITNLRHGELVNSRRHIHQAHANLAFGFGR